MGGSGDVFIGSNGDTFGEWSPAITVDSSYSERVVPMRCESTSCKGLAHHFSRDPNAPLHLEFYCIISYDPILPDAVHSLPKYTDTSWGSRRNHITGDSSGR